MDTKFMQIFKFIKGVYCKYFRILFTIFCFMTFFMASHAGIALRSRSELPIYLILFCTYFYLIEAYSKNKQRDIIPLFLVVISYYIYFWDSIKHLYDVLLFGSSG